MSKSYVTSDHEIILYKIEFKLVLEGTIVFDGDMNIGFSCERMRGKNHYNGTQDSLDNDVSGSGAIL